MIKVYDLSQRIENGMTYFPGDPEPRLRPAGAAAPWLVSELSLGSHTGTHIDAPSHFFPGGKTIDQLAVQRFLVTGVVIPVLDHHDDQEIRVEELTEPLRTIPKGGGIIIRTDWSRFWGTDRYTRHPYLSAEASQAIVQSGAGLVAIDALNVDSTVQETSHAHQLLLGNDCLIVENLTGLAQLEPRRLYHFSFLPLPLAATDGSPVRAVAWEM